MENSSTNATTPSSPPFLWVPEPTQRGTFGIISLCLSTLLICIWNALHFNIPIRRHTFTDRFFLQVSWMFITLLTPEVLLFLAINERVNASVLLKKVLIFHPHLAETGMLAGVYNWTNGLVKSKEKQRYKPIEQPAHPHFGLVHAFYAIMGGFAFSGPHGDNNPTIEESPFQISTNPPHTIEVPEFDTLVYIMKHFPHIITDISRESILDRAESSILSKALLIVQVAWFCTNCASRRFQVLPLSLLEVTTAAHAFCTLITYIVWWPKPLNIAAPTFMKEKEALEVYALLKCSHVEYDEALKMAREMAEMAKETTKEKKRAAGDSLPLTAPRASAKIVLAANSLQHLLPTPEPPPLKSGFKELGSVPGAGHYWHQSPDGRLSMVITMAVFSIFYGLVHFLAWSDAFPTPVERLLWRIASLVETCSVFVGVLVVRLMMGSRRLEKLGLLMSIVVTVVHMLASGFIIVESCRQVFFLDATAYQLPLWANYWPHFS